MSPPRTAARKATFVSSLSLYEHRNRRQEDLLRKNKTPFTAAPLQRKTRTGLLMGTGNLPNKAENYRPFNPQALLVSISVLMLLPVPFGEGIPAVSYSPDMRPSELAGHFAVVLVVRVSIRVLIRVRKSMLVFGSRCWCSEVDVANSIAGLPRAVQPPSAVDFGESRLGSAGLIMLLTSFVYGVKRIYSERERKGKKGRK
jgi:hypothetical protein